MQTTRHRVPAQGDDEPPTRAPQTPTLPYERGLRGEDERVAERPIRKSGRMRRAQQRARSRYVLAGQIASGGMATVHLALQQGAEGFHRVVALKQIHPHLARHREFCQMFIDEARIAARINHPSVCRILDFGRGDEGYFLAMEYLAGEPLSRIVRAVSKRAELREWARYPLLLARIFSNLAEGLYAAHTLTNARGEPLHVVHRDVTPQNLFVLYDGSVRITDFGIVHARQRVHQTEGNFLKGKLAYMAPEQLERKPVDHRADLWALGVALWECLTFQRLFQGRSEGEILMQVMSAEILPPSMTNPNVPRAIDAVVERALARDPEQRYASARELSRDLEHCLGMAHDTVPTMDVAEWMRDVFPGGNERVAQIVKSALLLSSIPPPSSEGFSSLRPGASSSLGVLSAPADSVRDAASADAEAADPPDAETHRSAVAPVQRTARRSWPIAAAAVAIALAAVALGAYAIATAPAKRVASGSLHTSTPRLEAPAGDAATAPSLARLAAEPGAPGSNANGPSDTETNPVLEAASGDESRSEPEAVAPSATEPNTAPESGSEGESRSEPEAVAPALTQYPASPPAPPPRASDAPRANKAASRPAPPAATRVGSVALSTPQGGAMVFENGSYLGKTPARLTLPIGRHTLVVRPLSGAPERTVVVEVTAGALSFVTVDFPPPAASRAGSH